MIQRGMKWLGVAAGASLVGVALCGGAASAQDNKDGAGMQEVKLELPTPVFAGTLAANEQATLATKVAGRLASMEVDIASPVKQGQQIAQIETADYELGVQQAQAALGQAKA